MVIAFGLAAAARTVMAITGGADSSITINLEEASGLIAIAAGLAVGLAAVKTSDIKKIPYPFMYLYQIHLKRNCHLRID